MSRSGLNDAQARWSEEIRQRLAMCTQAGDARKADIYAACFAQDGVLALDHTNIAGREQIRAWMHAPSVIPAPSDGPPGFISHHLTTSHITFVDEVHATVRTYWLVTSASGLDHNGFYVDALRRVEGEWLIAHRKPKTLWISPTSVLNRS